MATRDIYENGFDEDVSTDNTTTCPECNGRVRTNSVETACEDCGLGVRWRRVAYVRFPVEIRHDGNE